MNEITFFPMEHQHWFSLIFAEGKKAQFPSDSAQPVSKTANKKSCPGVYIFRKFTVPKLKKFKRLVQHAGLIT
jgi:hypothetical protein